MRRTLGAIALAAATAFGTVAATVAPASAAPTYDVKPGALPRGADVRIPHLEGKTIVDGSTRITVHAANAQLLGKAPGGYVVGTHDADYESPRIWLYPTDGARRLLVSGFHDYAAQLSDEGTRLAVVRSAEVSRVVLIATKNGARLGARDFKGYATALDVAGDRVMVSAWSRGTRIWNASTQATRLISKRAGYAADLSHGLFASYTKDPYDGGCSVLAPVGSPDDRIWTGCNQRIVAFNPDATRVATIDILSDGLGPREAQVHRTTGRRLASYTIDGWFGAIEFESGSDLLLGASGQVWTATVRCNLAGCVRASDVTRTVQP